jgi:chromosome segregation ATPase
MNQAFKRFLKFVSLLVLLALLVGVWLQRQAIYDWWRLRDYAPPAAIVKLADNTTMNDYARHVFYVNHPKLEDKSSFNDHCRDSEFSIILGCYVERQGIYIYDVTDERLSGIEEVTAAHELLHAGYDRLSKNEQERIDELTAKAFANVTSKRVRETVENYRKHDPSIVPNELHSILATEVKDLPPELEQYYKKYFTNRVAIVKYSEQYENEFESRKAKVEAYDAQLAKLKEQIESNQDSLEQLSSELQTERARLNQLLTAKDYEAYNAGVSSFNAKVSAYNTKASTTRDLIEQYNQIVATRNAIALEEQSLVKAIDSRPQTLQSQ